MRVFPLRPSSPTSTLPLSARRSRPRTTWRLRQALSLLSLQSAAVLLACAARPLDTATGDGDTEAAPASTGSSDPGTTGGDDSSSPTTTAPSTTTTTTGPDVGTSTTGAPDSTGSNFIPPEDVPFGEQCDVWTEDCPEGQKCMPVSLDGDHSWESLKCVPVVDAPDGLYEPCTLLGTGLDGLDTCEKHMMCWEADPNTKIGHCVGMCTGSPDQPSCGDPDAFCAIGGDSVLALCLPGCDPLAQDCPGNDLCIPNPQDPESFLCVIEPNDTEGVFGICEYPNACDSGLVCVGPELAAECDQAQVGCCLPYCDTSLPNTCPGAGQECLPWFGDGAPPDDLKNLGLCGLMQ